MEMCLFTQMTIVKESNLRAFFRSYFLFGNLNLYPPLNVLVTRLAPPGGVNPVQSQLGGESLSVMAASNLFDLIVFK